MVSLKSAMTSYAPVVSSELDRWFIFAIPIYTTNNSGLFGGKSCFPSTSIFRFQIQGLSSFIKSLGVVLNYVHVCSSSIIVLVCRVQQASVFTNNPGSLDYYSSL